MDEKCKMCKNKEALCNNSMAMRHLCRRNGFNAFSPVTNADKYFRNATDEELAELLAKQEYKKPTFDGWLPLCNHVMGSRTCHENGCRKCWLDWLKQGVESDA